MHHYHKVEKCIVFLKQLIKFKSKYSIMRQDTKLNIKKFRTLHACTYCIWCSDLMDDSDKDDDSSLHHRFRPSGSGRGRPAPLATERDIATATIGIPRPRPRSDGRDARPHSDTRAEGPGPLLAAAAGTLVLLRRTHPDILNQIDPAEILQTQ